MNIWEERATGAEARTVYLKVCNLKLYAMKLLTPLFFCLIAIVSCNEKKDPRSVKAQILSDRDFIAYINSQKKIITAYKDPALQQAFEEAEQTEHKEDYFEAMKTAGGAQLEESAKTSYYHYQQLYRKYISKNLISKAELNVIIKEKLAQEL